MNLKDCFAGLTPFQTKVIDLLQDEFDRRLEVLVGKRSDPETQQEATEILTAVFAELMGITHGLIDGSEEGETDGSNSSKYQ